MKKILKFVKSDRPLLESQTCLEEWVRNRYPDRPIEAILAIVRIYTRHIDYRLHVIAGKTYHLVNTKYRQDLQLERLAEFYHEFKMPSFGKTLEKLPTNLIEMRHGKKLTVMGTARQSTASVGHLSNNSQRINGLTTNTKLIKPRTKGRS